MIVLAFLLSASFSPGRSGSAVWPFHFSLRHFSRGWRGQRTARFADKQLAGQALDAREHFAGQQIERIKRLLIETTYPINELARMMGFRAPAHMIAVFKAATGATPGQFRRNFV